MILKNAEANRNTIITQLKGAVDTLFPFISQWVPYLAYKQGDVAANIQDLNKAVKDANNILTGAKEETAKKMEELKKIISAARDASAEAGAAVFTNVFQNEATTYESRAKIWLIASIVFLAITLSSAILMWNIVKPATIELTFQILVMKFIILSMLISSAIWCGKQYRTLSHLSSINNHRAKALLTLEAFLKGASDESTKDAVLMETTRAIFQAGNTGYLDEQSSQNYTPQIIEISKLAKGLK